VRQYTEYWTLIRGRSASGDNQLTPSCPNCGADIAVNMAGACQHCHVKVTRGDFDGVLSRIEQDEAYRRGSARRSAGLVEVPRETDHLARALVLACCHLRAVAALHVGVPAHVRAGLERHHTHLLIADAPPHHVVAGIVVTTREPQPGGAGRA